MGSYRIPKARTRVEIKVSNSRFIATAGPADSARAARAFIDAMRSEMPDATHHVYAFRIGHGASISEGMSDDGEPSGTAGPPTMAVLRGTGLGDVVLVITRYFGGTKLGTGGLVAAYADAARAACAALSTEDKVARQRCSLQVPYALLEPVRRALAGLGGVIESEDFGEQVQLQVLVPLEHLDQTQAMLGDLSAGKIHLQRCP